MSANVRRTRVNATGRRSRVNPVVAGVVAGVLIGLVVSLMATINLTYGAPWAPTHTMVAQVTDADSMSVGSDVRIAGRLVGQVTSVQSAGDHTNITFNVDPADWPLANDTTANVRLATLLGQKYIQLNPGHSSAQLPDGAVLGVQSVRPVVDFDQIVNTFDKPTRDALTSLIRTAGASVQGQEGTLQQFFPDLSDLSVHSQVPTQELVTRNTEFNNILANLGTTAQQLDQSRNDLAGVITNLNNVIGTLASNEGQALKAFITNTDQINLTTDAVLGAGYAAKLDAGLQKVGTFAGYFNSLLATLIPQTKTFTQPVAAAEPSDILIGAQDSCTFPPGGAVCSGFVGHSNGAIPSKAAIDLIYEIADAASQGYGSFNYGSPGAPNFQGNFFLRQFALGSDPCLSFPSPIGCLNDQGP
jgi:virulence factor Mce-like protein